MRFLVTGSSGHLGEALMRTLRQDGQDALGLDLIPRQFTTHTGSITNPTLVRRCLAGVDVVFHTATLHKPHVSTHPQQAFIDTNLTGTLTLLEESINAGVKAFIFTSTTSVFGNALVPPEEAPAAWITEEVVPVSKNIYGVTKAAAEDLCELAHRNRGLPCVVLRTSRFFPEEDDNKAARNAFADTNLKLNELLHRRVDLEDVVSAHLLAARHAEKLGFGRFIVSATTPFSKNDLGELRTNAPAVLLRLFPDHEPLYQERGWKMTPSIDRVYVNDRARQQLHWLPRHSFQSALERLRSGGELTSPLARQVGRKGYHDKSFADGPYPVSGL